MFSVLRFQDEMLFNKSLTHTCFKNTTRGVDSDGRPGEHPAVAKLETPRANSSWIYIRWHTGRSPPPHSTLFHSLSLCSIHPSMRPAAHRSRSACRPVSSACRRTVGGPLVLRAPHIFSSRSGDQRGEEAGNTGSALSPLPGSMCFNVIFFCVL